jgi:GMP synthase (glutamine-hydrolysing)
MKVFRAGISKPRLDLLRDADAIVRDFCSEHGFEDQVWQFPVILIPLGSAMGKESIVLRPVNSVDGMTADVVLMGLEMLEHLTQQLLGVANIDAVFYDLTHKPPGTIEWE